MHIVTDVERWKARRCIEVKRIPEPGSYSKRSLNSLNSTNRCRRTSYNDNSAMVSAGLTAIGVLWAMISFLATCASCVGYMLPYWIQGSMLNNTQAVYFGVFRRCNYPTIEAGFVNQCGRYKTFVDIPSLSWQICTVVIGVGCIIAMFVSFTALLACCMNDLVTKRVGRFVGCLQFMAGILVGSGCVLYPLGWDHTQVQQACGQMSGLYRLGDCSMCFGYYTTIGGCGLLLLASLLSWKAGTSKTDAYGIVGHCDPRRV
ncbi:LHFPL tetraspan subfamily member 6 protein-like isoform X2 [Amphiura filiformis]|uniref:LHFPL tetraspan subfamily member 6 protein-like isoform X2 n=1 Tax=Amphiura filiformis TaxID=82378 RepID=UPI003B225664